MIEFLILFSLQKPTILSTYILDEGMRLRHFLHRSHQGTAG